MDQIIRALIPEPLRAVLRGRHNSMRYRFLGLPKEQFGIWYYRMTGRSYLQWYADRLDSFAEGQHVSDNSRFDSYFGTGGEDLEMLRVFGMTPQSTLFEIGVGHGRSAQHFASFLDEGNYVANDISRERIRHCRELFELRGISQSKAEFLVTIDNSFDWLRGRKFDFVWCGSVIAHMPPEVIEELLANVHKAMGPNTVYLFDYDVSEKTGTEVHDPKNYVFDFDWFSRTGSKSGLVMEDVSDRLPAKRLINKNVALMQVTLNREMDVLTAV